MTSANGIRTAPRTRAEFVQAYQSMGWAMFPVHTWEGDEGCSCRDPGCSSPGKHPISHVNGVAVAPHGCKDATNDLPTLLHWFSVLCPWANIGLATGEPSGVDVVDIDSKHDDLGFRSWRAFLAESRMGAPQTLTADTGGGGQHLFFNWTPGLGNRTGWIKGVDFKTTGGYVVLPPSDHASGRPYTWPETPTRPSPTDLPPQIREALIVAGRAGANGERLPDLTTVLNGVEEGARDDNLFRTACKLRRIIGDDPASRAMITELIRTAAANCSPPFPQAQADKCIEQAFKQDHSDSSESPHVDGIRKSHGGNGTRFARRFGHKVIFVKGIGWHEWDGSVWRSVDAVDVERLAKVVVEDLYDLAKADDLTAAEGAKAFTFAKNTDAPNGIDAMLRMARSDEGLLYAPNDLNLDPMMFAVENGVVDLTSGDLLPTSRFDLITARSPYAYDPSAKTPMWDAFLRWAMQGDSEMVGFLQRLAGIALRGDVPEHIMPVMLGAGRNGKNTFVETLTSILGAYATLSFPVKALTSPDMDDRATAVMYGKRLVVASEANKRVPLNAATVNSYTGDGSLRGRFLYKDTFEFTTSHLLMFVANNRPKVSDTKDGIWSRLKLVQWGAKISDARKVDHYHLKMLANEGPGIVAWCVAGALDYAANGLMVPDKVKQASASYRENEDLLGAFIKEHIVAEPDHVARREDLKTAYLVWCEANDVDRKDREGARDLIDSIGQRLPIDPNGRGPGGIRGIKGIRVMVPTLYGGQ